MTFLYPKVNHFGAICAHICNFYNSCWFFKKKMLSNQPVCSDHADWISPGHHFVSKFHGKGGRWTHKTWEPSFVRLSHLSRTEKPKTGLFISLLSLALYSGHSSYFNLMMLLQILIRWIIGWAEIEMTDIGKKNLFIIIS